MLTTPQRLAKAARVSRQAVCRAKDQGALREAKRGPRIDLSHPAAQKWLEARGLTVADVEPAAGAREIASDARRMTVSLGPGEDVALDAVLRLTLGELTDRHGTEIAFIDWLRSRKILAEARRMEVLLHEDCGRLIERDFVVTHVFGLLEQLSKRLLNDAPRTIARTITAKVKAGDTLEAIQRDIAVQLSKVLTETRDRAVRALRVQAEELAEAKEPPEAS